MPDESDMALLQAYLQRGSEEAFAELVRRHVNLVYSAAIRHVGIAALAEEITQAVFLVLARKAARLRPDTILAAWLYETTRLTALTFLRGERRRRFREQEAGMQTTFQAPTDDPVWKQLAPLLDEAMARLGRKDREALVLRFFQDLDLNEVAAALKTTEAAAQSRVHRAVGKLQKYFLKRGINSTSAAITSAISANSVQVAPTGLAKAATAAALAKSAASSISTLTLAKGALKLMAWTNTKTAIAVAAAVILAAGATSVVKISFFPSVKDASFEANYRHFQNLPSGQFVLRPTHFKTPAQGLDYSCESSSPAGEHVTWMMGRNRSFAQLIARLYNCDVTQVVLPPGTPKVNFDYLSTLSDTHGGERLVAAVQQKLGYVADWKDQDTQLFLLQLKTPDLPALTPDVSRVTPRLKWNSERELEVRDLSLVSLANEIRTEANVPVMDQTGRSTAYDFVLNCPKDDLTNRRWDAVNEALSKLGLELVPTNMPMRMLVVEKAK